MKKEKLKDICAYLLTIALFLLGTVWVILQAVRCIENILFAVMFFAAVALGG